jgi:hypothetical protein
MVNLVEAFAHTEETPQEPSVGNRVKPIWLAKKSSRKIQGSQLSQEGI